MNFLLGANKKPPLLPGRKMWGVKEQKSEKSRAAEKVQTGMAAAGASRSHLHGHINTVFRKSLPTFPHLAIKI